MTNLRPLVMTPGSCSFCGRPAEQHAVTRRWWHTGESCNPAYLVLPACAVPIGPLGHAAVWPPRFVPQETP